MDIDKYKAGAEYYIICDDKVAESFWQIGEAQREAVNYARFACCCDYENVELVYFNDSSKLADLDEHERVELIRYRGTSIYTPFDLKLKCMYY